MLLASDERRRAERQVFSADRRRAILARGLLRLLIGNYLNMPPQSVEIIISNQGKPAVSHPLEFNVTHSADTIAFAFSTRLPVGIDVEQIDPDIDVQLLAPRVLSSHELQEFEGLSRHRQIETFFAIWTRKEALQKALGEGLRRPLPEVGATTGRSPQTWRRLGLRPAAMRHIHVVDLPLRDGYAAALAIESINEPTVRLTNL